MPRNHSTYTNNPWYNHCKVVYASIEPNDRPSWSALLVRASRTYTKVPRVPKPRLDRAWIDHVKAYASDKKLSYKQSLMSTDCQQAWKYYKSTGSLTAVTDAAIPPVIPTVRRHTNRSKPARVTSEECFTVSFDDNKNTSTDKTYDKTQHK